MTHGIRCWNSNGFMVLDMNSRSFAVVASGSVYVTGAMVVNVNVSGAAALHAADRLRLTLVGPGQFSGGSLIQITETSYGYSLNVHPPANPHTFSYWVVLI